MIRVGVLMFACLCPSRRVERLTANGLDCSDLVQLSQVSLKTGARSALRDRGAGPSGRGGLGQNPRDA